MLTIVEVWQHLHAKMEILKFSIELTLKVLWGIMVKIGLLSNIITILGVPPPLHNVAIKQNIMLVEYQEYIIITAISKLLNAFVLKVEPNVLFDFISAVLETDTPMRLKIVPINTSDYGK
jgi:hypothetical protein